MPSIRTTWSIRSRQSIASGCPLSKSRHSPRWGLDYRDHLRGTVRLQKLIHLRGSFGGGGGLLS
jgi:hypothetical protein